GQRARDGADKALTFIGYPLDKGSIRSMPQSSCRVSSVVIVQTLATARASIPSRANTAGNKRSVRARITSADPSVIATLMRGTSVIAHTNSAAAPTETSTATAIKVTCDRAIWLLTAAPTLIAMPTTPQTTAAAIGAADENPSISVIFPTSVPMMRAETIRKSGPAVSLSARPGAVALLGVAVRSTLSLSALRVGKT